ncbi:acyl carrier protein, partial [Xenorhabdus bovienii]|uniref:acyl carrier protein n=1 Tax=Xenorhabdus bovienii TaxID=40576 RepID=UPI0023B26347
VKQLKTMIGKELGIRPTQLRASDSLDKYGIDSAIAVQLVAVLEKTFGSLPKTLFYEYKCIADIARYLARTVIHHSEKPPMATVLENTERGKGRERCRPSAKPRHSPSDQPL